tara:strand:+ start:3055 stop:3456 length:402 start_codon:yes stop_codon:yes gene_type:complete
MDNKQLILKTFNKQLSEFIEDISNLFPGEKDIIVLGTFMKTVMYGKPRAIIDVWYRFITIKYNNEIENGEIEYFLNKDYSEDLEATPGSTDVLEGINKLRSTIKKAFDQDVNKEKTVKYMQNLTKLSNLYYNN